MSGFVYKFLNENGEVIYIGSTGDMTKRMYKHFHDKRNGKMNKREYDSVKTVSFCKTKSRNDAYILETVLIQKYKPMCNTASVKDGEISFSGIDENSFSWESKKPNEFGTAPHNMRSKPFNQYSYRKRATQDFENEVRLFRALHEIHPDSIIRTSKLKDRHYHELLMLAMSDPDYWFQRLTSNESGMAFDELCRLMQVSALFRGEKISFDEDCEDAAE